nr:hypothetical protein [uncultured Roseateles sp.]
MKPETCTRSRLLDQCATGRHPRRSRGHHRQGNQISGHDTVVRPPIRIRHQIGGDQVLRGQAPGAANPFIGLGLVQRDPACEDDLKLKTLEFRAKDFVPQDRLVIHFHEVIGER